MGIYTDSHGNTYSINIGDPELQMISNNPDFHFCWMNENGSIQDENSDFYQDKTENNNKRRVLKEQITVRTAAGETITGYNRNRKQAWG